MTWWSGRFATKTIVKLQRLVEERPPVAPKGPGPVSVTSAQDTALFVEGRNQIIKEVEALAESSRIPVLIEQLTLARYDRRWEKTYYALFPSQLLLLKALLNASVTKSDAEKSYAEVQAHTPLLKDRPFGSWLQFLVEESLITLTIDGYALSIGGQEFLMWKLRHMLPDKT